MNIKIKRLILAIFIIINCMCIFFLSGQDAEKSSKTSGVVVEKVADTITSINKKVSKETIVDNVTFYVRKTAHFSIYTLLGMLLMCEANTFEVSKKRRLVVSIIFGALYALSDEFHQGFVSGRSPEMRDVCIDTCGVLFGIIIILIIGKILYSVKKIRNYQIREVVKENSK